MLVSLPLTRVGVLVAVLACAAVAMANEPRGLTTASAYDDQVLADQPVMYLPLGGANGTKDLSGRGHHAVAYHAPATKTFVNGDPALKFDGVQQYVEVDDRDDLSISSSGVLTMEAWLRPDVLNFSHEESDTTPYVHWLGKSTNGQSEYAARMYSHDADWAGDGIDPPRPNRISGYAFNLSGGLGAGSYFQEPVVAGQWIHYVLVINTRKTSNDYPTGYTKIYRNGRLRDQDSLLDYQIVPKNGSAPFRIASVGLHGYFQGAIAKVALYKRELPAKAVLAHYNAARP